MALSGMSIRCDDFGLGIFGFEQAREKSVAPVDKSQAGYIPAFVRSDLFNDIGRTARG
jgi:hypothetical protein